MRYAGRIIKWKDERGFGFIEPMGGGNQVFVHIKSFATHRRRPTCNENVSYEIEFDGNGRAQAKKVLLSGERMPLPKAVNPDHSIAFIILAIVFMLFISGSFFIGNLPFSIFVLYWGGSIISFIVYRIDKSAAESGQWRIREGTLGFLALIGGWPGALVAQRLFHHKTNKKSFQFSFWIIVILNCCLLCLSLTASGSAVIH